MPTEKVLVVAAAIALVAGFTGCANWGSQAEPHQHMRDAKQGTTYPAPESTEAPRKPLHDHREMK